MSADLNIILPEILLALFAIFALLGGVYTGKDGVASTLVWLRFSGCAGNWRV